MPKHGLDGASCEPSRKKHRHAHHQEDDGESAISYEEAWKQLPPQTSPLNSVPPYTEFTVVSGLPQLPPVADNLSSAPFRHKSTVTYDRSVNNTQVATYERLEFLGDTYLELIASRLIFSRLPHLQTGQMSQLRELLVKNETLCEYGCAYGFDKRVLVADMNRMQADARDRGNKGFNKIVGDVFEAYVAAVILSDPENGFAVAEKWLTALWAPKLYQTARTDRFINAKTVLTHDEDADPRTVYDPSAKNELQRKILRDSSIKLLYKPYKSSVELKGAQLGQNRHFIAVYLTGFGFTNELLGKGEGKNKVEAGNWAATEAMHGMGKKVVEECEEVVKAMKAAREAAKVAQAVSTEG